jgi:hypothetical protein
MSYNIAPQTTLVGNYPDTVQGTPFVEQAEEKYKLRYALGVCTALREADPKGFEDTFGAGDAGLRNCALKAGAYADRNFDMWKVKWPTALRAQIAAFG